MRSWLWGVREGGGDYEDKAWTLYARTAFLRSSVGTEIIPHFFASLFLNIASEGDSDFLTCFAQRCWQSHWIIYSECAHLYSCTPCKMFELLCVCVNPTFAMGNACADCSFISGLCTLHVCGSGVLGIPLYQAREYQHVRSENGGTSCSVLLLCVYV